MRQALHKSTTTTTTTTTTITTTNPNRKPNSNPNPNLPYTHPNPDAEQSERLPRQGNGYGSGQGFHSILMLTYCTFRSLRFARGQWLNGIRYERSYVYTLVNRTQLTKSAALTDGRSSL